LQLILTVHIVSVDAVTLALPLPRRRSGLLTVRNVLMPTLRRHRVASCGDFVPLMLHMIVMIVLVQGLMRGVYLVIIAWLASIPVARLALYQWHPADRARSGLRLDNHVRAEGSGGKSLTQASDAGYECVLLQGHRDIRWWQCRQVLAPKRQDRAWQRHLGVRNGGRTC
jgi:hypothetical protein